MQKYLRTYSAVEKELARLRKQLIDLRAVGRRMTDPLEISETVAIIQETRGKISALKWVSQSPFPPFRGMTE
jgi:hypothetical protein